jgi:hypothetical protein
MSAGADSALTLESIFGLTHHGRGSASVSVWFRAVMQVQSSIGRIGENGSAADRRQQMGDCASTGFAPTMVDRNGTCVSPNVSTSLGVCADADLSHAPGLR